MNFHVPKPKCLKTGQKETKFVVNQSRNYQKTGGKGRKFHVPKPELMKMGKRPQILFHGESKSQTADGGVNIPEADGGGDAWRDGEASARGLSADFLTKRGSNEA